MLVTDDIEDAHHSPVQLALVAPPAPVCAALAQRVSDRRAAGSAPPPQRTAAPAPPRNGEPLRAAHVMAALAERLPADTVVVEETPSSRPDLHRLLPARTPLGFLSAAMGGLGFALPAAIGVRMAAPHRPVVAVVGDGSSLYGIQALWSAAHYRVGVLFVVLANGRYAVMDRLAEQAGGRASLARVRRGRHLGVGAGVGLPGRARRLLRRHGQGARRGRAHPDRPHRTTRARHRRHTRGHLRTVTAQARRHPTRRHRWRTLK